MQTQVREEFKRDELKQGVKWHDVDGAREVGAAVPHAGNPAASDMLASSFEPRLHRAEVEPIRPSRRTARALQAPSPPCTCTSPCTSPCTLQPPHLHPAASQVAVIHEEIKAKVETIRLADKENGARPIVPLWVQ